MKTKGYSQEDWKKVNEHMEELLKSFSEQVGTAPYGSAATLGAIPTGFANTGGYTATVEVVVSAPSRTPAPGTVILHR